MTNKNLGKVILSLGFTVEQFKGAIFFRHPEKKIAILPVEDFTELKRTFFNDFLTTYREKSYHALVLPHDVWVNKTEILISQIKVNLGNFKSIHGRLCEVKPIDSDQACTFLDEHHLLGCTKGLYSYGLFEDQELVGVALFGRPLVLKHEPGEPTSYELIRYCSKKGTVIQGGLSKILSHFKSSYQPDEIMTSIDLGYSSGYSFKKIGFTPKETTPPINKGGKMVSIGNLRLTKSYGYD